MATSVRRPFIGNPQRAVVPSVCNGTATSCSFDPQCKGENRLFLGRRSLSVRSSDRIEGCIEPAIRLTVHCRKPHLTRTIHDQPSRGERSGSFQVHKHI